jgi:hypothetical protein
MTLRWHEDVESLGPSNPTPPWPIPNFEPRFRACESLEALLASSHQWHQTESSLLAHTLKRHR